MRDDDKPDTEGIAREAREDPEAFARLFRRLQGRLEMWIKLRMGPLLRSRLTEDDVLQETFLQAHKSLGDFRDEGAGSFRRWVFSVAENRLRDLHKYHDAQKRTPVREAQPAPRTDNERQLLQTLSGSETSPSAGAHRADLVAKLTGAIARLPEDLREVLVLRAVEDHSFTAIAKRLDVTQAKAKGLYARALKGLKRELTG